MALEQKTVLDFLEMKKTGEPVVGTVCYDALFARLVQLARIKYQGKEMKMDWILIGDSVKTSYGGKKGTISATMSEMIYHSKMVALGAPYICKVGDMPFLAYLNPNDAVKNAARFCSEAETQMVKLEGASEKSIAAIEAIVGAEMKVMGHLGLIPQTAEFNRGYVAKGLTVETAEEVIGESMLVQEAGASALLLEAVPEEVAKIVTDTLDIPVFGIGAGYSGSLEDSRYYSVNGQLLLIVDLLGMSAIFNPDFVKLYTLQAIEILRKENKILNFSNIALYAIQEYIKEVKLGEFPAKKHVKHMKEGEYEKLQAMLEAEKEKKKEKISEKIENTV